ncbi:MAG: NAD-dependent epimerase/dehydratase family protein [Candidatus Methylumidiphilus sp.]
MVNASTLVAQSSDLGNGMLVVTGATGWFGRTALHELQQLLGPESFSRRVRAFASRSRTIASTGFVDGVERPIPVAPLAELPELAAREPIDALLHTAFLTREHVERVGVEEYISVNRGITDLVCRSLEASPAARAVVISSGAAAALDGVACIEEHLHADPYGVLKVEEERRLGEIADTLVLRAYAVSGRFMRDPEQFALGDFLLRALRRLPIVIKAPMPVIRGYGHAGDMVNLAFHWLWSEHLPPAHPIAAVSQEVELLELARRISSLYDLPPTLSAMDPGLSPNRYTADPALFVTMLYELGIVPHSLKEQIFDTAFGLKALQAL